MSTIGSFICVRNGHELDYSWQLAAESLLKVVDELVLCDSESSDGTLQAMQRMADRDSRIKVITYPWPNPVRESHHWFIKWLRFAQVHVKSPWLVYLDADETLDDSPECHSALREAAKNQKSIAVDRLNYWKNPQSLIPDGHCCGKWCIRGGPSNYPVVSDEPHHSGEEPIVDSSVKEPRVKIHHLGFLRRKEAFYAKSKVVLEGWFGRWDQRLELGEREDKPVWETECEFTDLLVQATHPIPMDVQQWLADRGHFTEKLVPKLEAAPDPVIEVSEIKPTHQPWGILHYGDFGDVIHMLPICKALGMVNLYFSDRNSVCKRILERLHVLQPLLESQRYVGIAKGHEGEDIHWNAGEFRQYHSRDNSLAKAHFLHYQGQKHLPKVQIDLKAPWITGIMPDQRSKDKIVIHRSDRYHNHFFRWKTIVDHYGKDNLLFIGFPSEHRRFCEAFGEVTYIPTANLLEAAQIIAGSEWFMGNQSVCMAIAEGLKHRRVMEACPWQPDVVVESGPDCIVSGDGGLKLPPTCGKPELIVGSGLYQINYLVQTSLSPRTGWHRLFPEHAGMSTYKLLNKQLQKAQHITEKEAHKLIVDRLYAMEPDYFPKNQSQGVVALVDSAILNSQKPLT